MRNLSFSAQLLKECRDLAAQRLGTILPDLMDKVDDALFDLADKGENNQVQALYFGAMREVRLRRATIEADFRICLAHAVNDRIRQFSERPIDGPEPGEPDSFLLVEHDELEESLAVTNMAGKIRSACKGALFLLDKRMAFLLDDADLDPADDPIGPEVICGAFKDACRCIQAEIEVKLLILKIFDRFVVQEMEPLYDEINGHLVKREVLPNLKPTVEVRRNPAGTAASALAPADSAAPALAAGSGDGLGYPGQDPGQSLLSALQALMGAGGASGPGGISIPAAQTPSSVIGALTALQGFSQNPAGMPAGMMIGPTSSTSGGGQAEPLAIDLRSLKGNGFAELLGSAGGPLGSGSGADADLALGQMNEMLIDIVAMMFDYILDDENLAPPMRALIGRLQIPVLKVAILDRTLFSRRFHPARKLLNAFAEAAFGWDESSGPEDPLHRKMDELIHRILDEFDDDVAVFASVLETFERFVEEEERERQRRIDRQAAALERRERLQDAKQAVKQEVRRALDGALVPPIVKRFITRYWGGNLVVVHMKHGPQSQPWAIAVETMDRLIWSVTAKDAPEERARLVALLPTLRKRVSDEVAKVSMPPEEHEELEAVLAARHAELVRAPNLPADTADIRDTGDIGDIGDTGDTVDQGPQVAAENDRSGDLSGDLGESDEPATIASDVALLFGEAEAAAPAVPPTEDDLDRVELAPGDNGPPPGESDLDSPPDGETPSEALSIPPAGAYDNVPAESSGGLDAVGPGAELPPASDPESDRVARGAFVHPEQDLLVQTIARANRLIYDAQLVDPTKSGMGTTLVTAIFRDNRIHYAHVGDSRLYRHRDGHLTQLTRDHSLMQELIDKGFYSPEEAAEQVNKNLVTRGLGVEASVQPDVADDRAEVDDLFLLCTDGLTDMVEDRQLEAIVKRYRAEPEQLVDVLIKRVRPPLDILHDT